MIVYRQNTKCLNFKRYKTVKLINISNRIYSVNTILTNSPNRSQGKKFYENVLIPTKFNFNILHNHLINDVSYLLCKYTLY